MNASEYTRSLFCTTKDLHPVMVKKEEPKKDAQLVRRLQTLAQFRDCILFTLFRDTLQKRHDRLFMERSAFMDKRLPSTLSPNTAYLISGHAWVSSFLDFGAEEGLLKSICDVYC